MHESSLSFDLFHSDPSTPNVWENNTCETSSGADIVCPAPAPALPLGSEADEGTLPPAATTGDGDDLGLDRATAANGLPAHPGELSEGNEKSPIAGTDP